MELIGMFLSLLACFLIIGIAAAVHKERERHEEPDEDDWEESPHIVISQQVPSVFDTFNGKK